MRGIMMPRRDADPPKPKEAIDFLKRKKIVESEAWDDLKWGEHAHAFTAAHSAGAGILDELHKILIEAQQSGQSYQKTKREIKTLMAEKGWYGRPDIDPEARTPEGKPDKTRRRQAKEYINWRIGIIYQQNQLTAYSAAQTRKLWGIQHIYPYWQYKQRQRKNKRQSHAAWHNMVLKADDPAWDTITPPNGWRCACYRSPLTQSQAEREWQAGARKTPPGPGEGAPKLDPTWAYNPAKEALAPNWKSYDGLRKAGALRSVMENYRNELAKKQMSKGEWREYSKRLLTGKSSPNKDAPIHLSTLEQQVIDTLGGAAKVDAKLMATDKAIIHGGRGRNKNGEPRPERDLSLPQIADMPGQLANPEQIFRDQQNGTWLFVYGLNKEEEARVIFRQNGNRPLQLVSYTKVSIGNTRVTTGEPVYTK